MDEIPQHAQPIRVGDFVRVTAHEFENCRAVVEALTGDDATVRFIIFRRDCGTRSFPLRILEKVETLDPTG